jgi:phosphatidylserine/phosphatidylglycerophosphate/cardiolipin synthase-like enzyme
MSSKEDSGRIDPALIIQLAHIFMANPWLKLDLLTKSAMKYGRSLAERQIISLVERIGPERQYSLAEVTNLLLAMAHSTASGERLLVAPSEVLDFVPPGKRVDTIPNHLEGIVRKAEREILLLAPFWDISTLINLLRCTAFQGMRPELVLLLVHIGNRLPNVKNIADSISSIWTGRQIRIYLHLAKPNDQASYPHAKCLVIDRSYGYLGSANFTGQGMEGHFELGVSLGPEASKTLGDLLQHLWSKTKTFTLAWDNRVENVHTQSRENA